jgi:hypothetical protein
MDEKVLVYRGADQPDMSVINPESDVWQNISVSYSTCRRLVYRCTDTVFRYPMHTSLQIGPSDTRRYHLMDGS